MAELHLDDRRAVLAAAVTSAVMLAHQVGGRAVRDALFLTHFPVTTLSALIVSSALISAAVALPWSWILWRQGPDRLVPRAFVASALLLIAIWVLAFYDRPAAAIATYLHTVVMGPVIGSGFWSLISERFDVRTAKRTVGRLAAIGTLGGIAGGVLADVVSERAGALVMLLVLAALHLICASWVRGVVAPRPAAAAPARPGALDLLAGVRAIATRPYLRDVGLLVVVGAAGAALLEYAFKAEAAAAATGPRELVRLFAVFHSGVAALTFLLQVLFSGLALQRAGLGRTVALQPLAMVLGGAAAAVAPGILTAFLARGGESVIRGSLFRSGYQLLFGPVPVGERRSAKSLIDIGLDRVGEAGGGALTAILVAVAGSVAPLAMLWTTVVLGLLGLWLALRLQRGYFATLESSLVSSAFEADASGLVETAMPAAPESRVPGPAAAGAAAGAAAAGGAVATHASGGPVLAAPDPLLTLAIDRASLGLPPAAPRPTPPAPTSVRERADALASGDPVRIRSALVGRLPASLVPLAIPLVGRAEVAGEALHALRDIGPSIIGQVTDALLDPDLPLDARRRLARLLGSIGTPRAVEGLLQGLDDPRFVVRHACGLALARVRERAPETHFDPDRIFTQVHREVDVERGVWLGQREIERLDDPSPAPIADAYLRERASASLEHVFNLLSLVLPRQPLQVAFRGLSGDDRMLRGMALEYLESVLPPPIRARLWPFLEEDADRPPSLRSRNEILGDLLRSHESIRIHISELRDPEPK